MSDWFKEAQALELELTEVRARLQAVEQQREQLEVKLSGCTAAALGYNKETAKQGDWGWSPSYQDVLDLRRKYEALGKTAADNFSAAVDAKDALAALRARVREIVEQLKNEAFQRDKLAGRTKPISEVDRLRTSATTYRDVSHIVAALLDPPTIPREG